jgi:DNA mismatch repair protein MutS
MLKKEIADILQEKKRSLIEQYLDIQQLSEERFGTDTVVIMEIGSFFEIYGIDNQERCIGKPKEIAELLNLQLTRKNKTIAENSVKNPLMAGFPSAAFDRYVGRIVQEQRYTIVVVRQDGVPPNVTRFLGEVLSPGVNFDFALDHDSHYTASLIVDEREGLYSIGYANMDVTTGKTHALEVHSTKEDPTLALDELFSVLQSFSTAELVITPVGQEVQLDDLMDYLELRGLNNLTVADKRLRVDYQNELIKEVFRVQSLLSPIEYVDLERTPMASEAFALLLNFVIEHDPALVEEIRKPERIESAAYVYLGNNPLEQLTVISDHPHERTLVQLVDCTRTSMGKRLLKERLLNPITSAVELNARYDLAEAVRTHADAISDQLKTVYDVERLSRRMTLGRLHPFELNFLYDSLQAAGAMTESIDTHQVANELGDAWTQLTTLRQELSSTFDLAHTTQLSSKDICASFFRSGVDAELDRMVQEQQALEQQLETIRSTIVELLENKTHKKETDYVVIKQLDKDGHYISMTKSRYFLVEKELKESFVSLDETVYSLGDFHFKVQTSNVKITSAVMDVLSEKIVALQQKVIGRTKELFAEQLDQMRMAYGEHIDALASLLARIDVAVSTVRSSDTLRLTRPEIVESEENQTLFEARALRHPLVEANEERGIYVPNDVVMGTAELVEHSDATMQQTDHEQVNGVLLYGINSSGKSSLMKSIGIAIILAQSGLYVPAEQLRFTVVRELFTRIVARDDLSKGLSSFAVEMQELKNIFRRCSRHSIVLGDEISHGTETVSAIAIVAAAVLRLSELGGLFVFATHLHQLQHVEQVANVNSVIMLHLAVEYDKESDALIFERQLQIGSGSSIYGLEFAQSLHMDDTFLNNARDIRKTLTDDYTPLELLTKQEKSKYNNSVYLTKCALCSASVDDTHHIKEQHTADEQGFIEHFPKDHKGNVIPLCKECHNKVHAGKLTLDGYVMTSKGWKLQTK